MTTNTASETFPLDDMLQVLKAKQDVILEWANGLGSFTIESSLNARQASILGAVLTMQLRTPTKPAALRVLFRDLVSYEGGDDEWLVVRRQRGVPQIEEPPIRIEVTSRIKAKPVIYDPQTFLSELRALSSSP